MWPSVLYFTTIFFGSVLTTAATVWIGHRNDWLVYPRSDRWSRALVVKFGGVSILLTFLLPLSVVVPSWPLRTVALLTAAMGLVGLVDDIFELLPSRKFASQFIVAAVAVWSGVMYPVSHSPFLNYALALVWILAITNGLNLLDNMDGLAAGVSVISASGLMLVGHDPGPMAIGLLAMTAALLGFLVFNFHPAKIFMGDTGSLGVGFFLACSAVPQARQANTLVPVLCVPVLILFLPIFDMLLVSVTRTLNGRAISAGAKDHTSHRLVMLGLSERNAVLTLYLFSLLSVVVAALCKRTWSDIGPGILATFFLGSAAFWIYLARVQLPEAWLSVPTFTFFLKPKPFKQDSTKPKVVRIIGRLNVGGPARQACFLHQALRSKFDTVLVAGNLDKLEGDMSYLLTSEDGVRWIRHMSRPIRPWSDFVAFLRIVRILREERPNIVHTHTAKAGTLGRLAATLLGIPVVHSYHGHVLQGYFGRLQTRIWLAIERALNKVTAQTLTVSESQANELVDQYRIVPRQKLCVVRDGYDLTSYDWEADGQLRRQLRRMFGFDDSHFVALWAGRLVPIKNVELLAQIIREAERWPSLRFLIVGDGTDRRKLETLTAGCSNAHIAGWRSDMPKLWAAADVGLLTSRNEGTPTALIEAMAAGKPFVSTKVGGVIDLAVPPIRLDTRSRVERAANGFLTPLVSNPMLNCLNFLARHPAEARSMGKVGHSFALTQHSDKRLQAEIERLYFDLLGSAHLAKRRELRRPNKQSA